QDNIWARLMTTDTNPITRLEQQTRSSWKNLEAARSYSLRRREELKKALKGLDSFDTSIVVFGSLARDEATTGSDTDWTLLVDGIADPEHADAAQEIHRRLEGIGAKRPG